MSHLLSRLLAMAALVVPLLANANVIQFNATLNGANEVPANAASATGVATLFYDTSTNTYDFSLSAFGLTGGNDGKAVNAAHIHGQATPSQNGGVLRDILTAPFVSFNSGSILLVGGDNIAAPIGLVGANSNHPVPQSFLGILQAGLAYVNLHTNALPGGEIRGQFLQVAVVPEAETYAMMLAGLGLIGFVLKRRRRA